MERAYLDAVERAGAAPGDDTDPTRVRILDAAFALFCTSGIERTSLSEIAQHAGTTRVTIYRKFDNKDDLVEEVLLREFTAYFSQFLADIAGADTAADRVVLGFVSSLRTISNNPLIGGMIESEPGLFAGSIISDQGRTLGALREFVAGQLRREQRAGQVSTDLDTELVAEMMVRVAASFLTVPSALVDLRDEARLAEIARRFLVPMLEPRADSA